jgi:hypothetical protein
MPGNLKGAELERFVRDAVMTYWHQTGTAKMGQDGHLYACPPPAPLRRYRMVQHLGTVEREHRDRSARTRAQRLKGPYVLAHSVGELAARQGGVSEEQHGLVFAALQRGSQQVYRV